MSESGWQTWRDHPPAERQYFKLTLTDFDMQRMDRERLEMIQAGVRLIEQAFRPPDPETPGCAEPDDEPHWVEDLPYRLYSRVRLS